MSLEDGNLTTYRSVVTRATQNLSSRVDRTVSQSRTRWTMNRFTIAAVLVGTSIVTAPVAQAETCLAHLASRGTTKDADIAYHAVHGGESPCKGSSSSSRDDRYDSRRHDDFGFHCTWHGCG